MCNVDTTKELRIISLCSGSLGIERGINQSGTAIRTVAYVEREAFVCYNLVRQMEAGMVDKAPIWTDVKTFNARPFRNKVHGIVGGYPCQGESLAGKREGMQYEGFIFPHIERQIIDSNPLFCFFENVGAHLSGSFPYVLSRLQRLGFNVEAGLYTAAETGAPHKRQRLFVFAWSNTDEMRRCLADSYSKPGDISSQPRRNDKVTAAKSCDALDRTVLPYSNGVRRSERGSVQCTTKPDVNGSYWPAPPGHWQYAYEESRVTGGKATQSGMGCSINGYDFRSDLLRMYGNGVVEQTATLAWKSLTSKALNS